MNEPPTCPSIFENLWRGFLRAYRLLQVRGPLDSARERAGVLVSPSRGESRPRLLPAGTQGQRPPSAPTSLLPGMEADPDSRTLPLALFPTSTLAPVPPPLLLPPSLLLPRAGVPAAPSSPPLPAHPAFFLLPFRSRKGNQ